MYVVKASLTHAILNNGKLVSHASLLWEYLCAACEGTLVKLPVVTNDVITGYTIKCGLCGATEFVSRTTIHHQQLEAAEVKAMLPREFILGLYAQDAAETDVITDLLW